MKTDREIAEEVCETTTQVTTIGIVEDAVRLARQYGALPAPAAPQAIDWQRVRIEATIAAMRSYVEMTGYNGPEVVASRCVERADAIVAALKKGGAA